MSPPAFRMSNWRGDSDRTKTIAENLLSLITIIQSVHAVVTDTDSENGDKRFKEVMKRRRNTESLDSVISSLMKTHDEVGSEVVAMDKRRLSKRSVELEPGEIRDASEPLEPKRKRDEEVEKPREYRHGPATFKQNLRFGDRSRSSGDFAFINMAMMSSFQSYASEISKFLKMCNVIVKSEDVEILYTGKMHSQLGRVYVPFRISTELTAFDDLKDLFHGRLCEPVKRMNAVLFGNDRSQYVTSVKGISSKNVFKYDFLNVAMPHLLYDFPSPRYEPIIEQGSIVFSRPQTSYNNIITCGDVYRKHNDIYKKVYEKMDHDAQQQLDAFVVRLNAGRR